jgi:hypothetical protein
LFFFAIVLVGRRLASVCTCVHCCLSAQPPPVVQRHWECGSGVNSRLKVDCQCPLVDFCRCC